MSFIDTSSDLSDFERFFYDQVRYRTDFFEEPNSKIVRWRLCIRHFSRNETFSSDFHTLCKSGKLSYRKSRAQKFCSKVQRRINKILNQFFFLREWKFWSRIIFILHFVVLLQSEDRRIAVGGNMQETIHQRLIILEGRFCMCLIFSRCEIGMDPHAL